MGGVVGGRGCGGVVGVVVEPVGGKGGEGGRGGGGGNLRGESSWVGEDDRCRPSPATNVGAGSDNSSGMQCTREGLDRTASGTSPRDGGHGATERACVLWETPYGDRRGSCGLRFDSCPRCWGGGW